jgi:hypothetical protein
MRRLPQSIARDPRPSSQARVLPPESVERDRSVDPSASIRRAPPTADRTSLMSQAVEKSVLRRTSLEEEVSEPAELTVEADEARPIQSAQPVGTLIAPISRTENGGAPVPENPLRPKR